MVRPQVAMGEEIIAGKPGRGVLPRSFAIWMLAAYIALFIIRPWEILLLDLLRDTRFEFKFALAVIAVVGVTRGFRFPLNRQNAAVVAFMAAMGISSMFAYNVELAWRYYYLVITVFVCYCLLVSAIRTPYELIFIVGAYIASMELYLAKALWEYFVHGRSEAEMSVTRLIGIEASFGDPNRLAHSIAISLPIWLCLWQCRREILVSWPKRWQRWTTYALAAYPAMGVLSIVLTNSRGGMLNLVAFVFLWRVGSGRVVRNLAIVGLIMIVGWLALPQEQKGRLETIWNPEKNLSAESSKQGRIRAFRVAMHIGRDFPVVGVGPGNFSAYRADVLGGERVAPHGLANELAAEVGGVGAIAFAMMIGTTLVAVRKTKAAAVGQTDMNLQVLSSLAHGFRNSMVLLFVEGLTVNSLYRFNWLWLVAFSMLAWQFAMAIRSSNDKMASASRRV